MKIEGFEKMLEQIHIERGIPKEALVEAIQAAILSACKKRFAHLEELEAKIDALLNSMADLDELHESGKIAEKAYWKERLELKAKVVAILKKTPPSLLESYATRHVPR